MGNADSNFTCEGAELHPVNTWWGRSRQKSSRSFKKLNQPMRRPNPTAREDFNLDFRRSMPKNVFETSRSNGNRKSFFGEDYSSVKNGSLSSEEAGQETERLDLSNSSCQDSGFGESLLITGLVSSLSPDSSPDVAHTRDLIWTPTEREEPKKTDVFRTRIRKLSDWTGSLKIKRRRVQDPDISSNWPFNPLQNRYLPQIQVQRPDQIQTQNHDQAHIWTVSDPCVSVYQNFRRDLDSKSSLGSNQASSDRDSVDPDEQSVRSKPGLAPGQSTDPSMDQGDVVRRAGWIWIKPLMRLSKGQLELVPRRKWKKYWVKLRGCWLQFFTSTGLDLDPNISNMGPVVELREGDQGPMAELHEEDPVPKAELCEGDQGPVMELRVWDSLVQPVPEHQTRENVFCLSTAAGHVYLLQAGSQSDLEAWITSVHSVAAAMFCRRSGHHGDTLNFLQGHVHFLSQRMEEEQRVKKMAALQLSLITDTDKRRSVQAQICQWEQTLEALSLDLFRFKSYLCSLQGLELPNPKNPLCSASRSSKSMLGKLGPFTVNTLHALVCSRDRAELSRHRGDIISQTRERRALVGLSNRTRQSFKSSTKVKEDHSDVGHLAPPPQVLKEEVEELTLQLSRTSSLLDYGFAVIGHVDAEGRSHIYISQVDPNGLSANQGLCVGDQVLSVNSAPVSRLDLDLIPSVFSHRTLLLSLRRLRPSPEPAPANQEREIQSCDTESSKPTSDESLRTSCRQSSEQIHALYQIFPECRAASTDLPGNPYDPKGTEPRASSSPAHLTAGSSHFCSSPSHLSVCQRIRKVTEELLETEKSYVKDLAQLLDLYLTPLQKETFLSKDEMEAMFGSLPAMLEFQRVFLRTLEEKIDLCPSLSSLETPEDFKKLLFSLGGSFLVYADHFKLYSVFCANHLKVQKVLQRAKTDAAFKHFLDQRNPTNQHSASLESFLIKPVQRVLKYPLLLRELVSLTEERTPERLHLTEALKSMEEVASHINEMQKIYDEFGSVFERLSSENSAPCGPATELSMGDFLFRSTVLWLNPFSGLRMRKDPQLSVFVFKQAMVLVHKDPKVKRRRVSRSDPDHFRFRWLIPASAAHLRNHDITDLQFEVIHVRSIPEGRPETVFQLSSSDVESKTLLLETLHSVLKNPSPQCSTQRPFCDNDVVFNDDVSLQNSPRLRPFATEGWTDQLEAQLQRLHFSDASDGVGRGLWQRRRGFCQSGRGLDEWRRSLVELGGLLDRDYSVQSLTSIINEDCFYNSIRRRKARPGLDLV